MKRFVDILKNKWSTVTASACAFTALFALEANAQRGEIESQTYEILKEKSIEFPKADRLFDKIQPATSKTENSKIQYRFSDPKLNFDAPKVTPRVIQSSDEVERKDLPTPLNNYIKLGAGNYGRFLGEGFVSSSTKEDLVFTGELKHLSAATGPVDDKNSGNASTLFRAGAKYLGPSYKVEATGEYDRKNYYFYGYQPLPQGVEMDRDSIRQTLNKFGFKLGLENTQPNTLIDYSVVTQLQNIKDRYNASELDWATNLQTSLPINNKFYALLNFDAFVSQRSDNDLTFNRNMFAVKPTFKYIDDRFSLAVGLNVMNETDNVLDVNRTRAFPDITIDVVPIPGMHITAGWNGGIVRNTLRTMLSENQWLGPNQLIANTIKNSDIFAGIKGQSEAVNFELKASFANYNNFYVYTNNLTDSTKFSAIYDGNKAKVLTFSGDLGYTVNDMFKTSLKGSYFNYNMSDLQEAWHRPTATASWFNALTISKKLFLTTELYSISGMKGINFQTGEVVKLKAINDLNLKIDYLLTPNFSAFVNINNIFGKEYERYMNYKQQGLNFIGGLSFSF